MAAKQINRDGEGVQIDVVNEAKILGQRDQTNVGLGVGCASDTKGCLEESYFPIPFCIEDRLKGYGGIVRRDEALVYAVHPRQLLNRPEST